MAPKPTHDLNGLTKARGAAKGLMIAGFIVALIPIIGVPISYALDRRRNRVIEKKQKQVLVDYYRPQIAAMLGISPGRVGIGDLETASQMDPKLFGNAVKKVEQDKKNANRAAMMASAGGSLAGMIPVPGAGEAAKLALHVGGTIAGGAASSLLDKDVIYTLDVVEMMEEKRHKNEPITAMDIVLLRIAQDPEWQAEFKKKNGKSFHKLGDAEKEAVLAAQPDMLIGADRQADALNRNLISPQNLVMAGPESTSNFAASAGAKPASQSFVAMEEQRRANAAAGVNQRA